MDTQEKKHMKEVITHAIQEVMEWRKVKKTMPIANTLQHDMIDGQIKTWKRRADYYKKKLREIEDEEIAKEGKKEDEYEFSLFRKGFI
jgi:hypothetical protein